MLPEWQCFCPDLVSSYFLMFIPETHCFLFSHRFTCWIQEWGPTARTCLGPLITHMAWSMVRNHWNCAVTVQMAGSRPPSPARCSTMPAAFAQMMKTRSGGRFVTWCFHLFNHLSMFKIGMSLFWMTLRDCGLGRVYLHMVRDFIHSRFHSLFWSLCRGSQRTAPTSSPRSCWPQNGRTWRTWRW